MGPLNQNDYKFRTTHGDTEMIMYIKWCHLGGKNNTSMIEKKTRSYILCQYIYNKFSSSNKNMTVDVYKNVKVHESQKLACKNNNEV